MLPLMIALCLSAHMESKQIFDEWANDLQT
jgi:hypothetical protein